MIRINVLDEQFNEARRKASRALPVEHLETPRQYGARWRESYRCRIDASSNTDSTYYIFDCDEDYTWFMLRWS